LAQRRYEAASRGFGGPVLEARWSDVNPSGDLLYVGCASTSVVSRLHPRAHFMWGVLEMNKRRAADVHIAVWCIPARHCESVERWMTQICAPLWSTAAAPERRWSWRQPDLLEPAVEFHPALRTAELPLMSGKVGGIYAWLIGTDVRGVMLGGVKARRPRRDIALSRPPRLYWRCWHCNDMNEGKERHESVCGRCGWTAAAGERAMDREMARAIRNLLC
jgi:hypothetical protein